MKPKIIAMVGPSGAGKTFAAEYLKKELGISVIVSFTTRPIRIGETNGVEHFFVEEAEMPPQNQMLAYTKFGGHHYWAEVRQALKNDRCIYVVDEKGLLYLMDNFSHNFEVIPVLIKRDVKRLSSEISIDRIKRDDSRINIEDNYYQYVIVNDGTLEEFKEKLLSTIKQI